MWKGFVVIAVFGAIFPDESFGKPTEIAVNSATLNPIAANDSIEADATRLQRSPQYGLLGDYGDYSDYGDTSRHFRLGHKRKFHKPHHKPFGFGGGHGCRGYDCGGGWQPSYGGHYNGHHPSGQGGTFATASAGSISGGGGSYGGHSQANAQSASFSFGPYTATFSVAQSSSGRKAF